MNREQRIEDNQFYHVYNRGNDRQPIFGDESDYYSFLEKMKSLATQYSVATPVYTLMPNHYHLIAQQNTGGNLSDMMGALATSAAKRYNLKYGHTGHLFQGPFRYKPVPEDSLWCVACYIHLNPVRAGLAKDPSEWKFSNFSDFLRKRFPSATAQAEKKEILSRDLWQDYAEYVREILKTERAEKEFWKRLQSHVEDVEGYLQHGLKLTRR